MAPMCQSHRVEGHVALTLGFWHTSIAVIYTFRSRSKSDATIIGRKHLYGNFYLLGSTTKACSCHVLIKPLPLAVNWLLLCRCDVAQREV